jgi:hypothetical protein
MESKCFPFVVFIHNRGTSDNERKSFLFMLATLLAVAVAPTFGAPALSNKYYVHSADVSYTGGFPGANEDTTTGNPPSNGYKWFATGSGGLDTKSISQLHDSSKSVIDAYAKLFGSLEIIGSASSGPKALYFDRDSTTITITVRYEGTSPPPVPSSYKVDFRFYVFSQSDLGIANGSSDSLAGSWYWNGTNVIQETAESSYPIGPYVADSGWINPVVQTFLLSSASWSNIAIGVWQMTLTLPPPPSTRLLEQDMEVATSAISSSMGSMYNIGTQTEGRWEYRLTEFSGVALQPDF